MRGLALWLMAVLMALLPVGVSAQGPVADPALRAKADALVAILDGRGAYDAYFAASFREKVPKAQFSAIAEKLKATLGAPQKIESLTATSPWGADLVVGYERGTASVRLVLDPAPPHAASGLLITGTGARDDSLAKVEADFRALPGASGLGLYALGQGKPAPILEYRADVAAPLGSAFKLWVLAELARQVASGERHWADVVKVGAPSLPSGVLQTWPAESLVTVQTLATMMISISDNTATDTLLTTLGRAKVDATAEAVGGSVPVMTTREMFALKGDPALTKAWAAGSVDGRRALLVDNAVKIATAKLDPTVFAGKPVAIDSVEWFASPAAMAGVLDRLHGADSTTRAVLAVNAGVDPAIAKRFGYVGFKGGGEPGVVTLNYLVQAKDGRWYAATGNWHRADDGVNELRFVGLMGRVLALLAAR
ncbi:serine hydrolase [Sphingomonas sp. OK281]|uniref:serine hydrolase n=1 Tax=Sphingomonas sp. OK281 TaxID=1881067 RepID=UPI0008E1584E|nr:serine hydrolase [Sphingomonas sp. OK281]SFO09135.1 Beta-lactamase enzyme family protein [Sphingomonas sp. OK281]